MLKRIAQSLAAQTDAASSAAFRIAFGIIALIAVARYFRSDWIARLYIEPAHHFPHWDLTLLQPLPAWGMHALFASLALFAAGIALGCRYRICAALFCIGFAYIELLDRATYLNHHYLMILITLLMAFLPLNRAASLDARRRPPSDDGMPPTIPAWTLWTLRAQIGAVYLFAGIAKLNPDWLLNALPLRIWLYQRADLPLIGALLQEPWTAYAMSWTGALFDLTIVAWLLWRCSRPWAYIALIAFHLITWLLFPRLGMFPLLMIAGALIFFPPEWPRRLFNRKPRAQQSPAASPPAQRLSWTARAAIAAASLFALTQIILPLRHFAYPGNVRWNEEGYRFAWRVMLTEKVGYTQYRVRCPQTGHGRLVAPDEYFTPLQTERMSTQPDMILQGAHIIAADFRARGCHAEVRADAFVAFNGRPNARLIHPDADLAAVKPGFAPKWWILPRRRRRCPRLTAVPVRVRKPNRHIKQTHHFGIQRQLKLCEPRMSRLRRRRVLRHIRMQRLFQLPDSLQRIRESGAHPFIRIRRQPRNQRPKPQTAVRPNIHITHPQHLISHIRNRIVRRPHRDSRRIRNHIVPHAQRLPQPHIRYAARQKHRRPHQFRHRRPAQQRAFRRAVEVPRIRPVFGIPRRPIGRHAVHLGRRNIPQRGEIAAAPALGERLKRRRLIPEYDVLHCAQPALSGRQELAHILRRNIVPRRQQILDALRLHGRPVHQRPRAPIHHRPEPHRLRPHPRPARPPPSIVRAIQVRRRRTAAERMQRIPQRIHIRRCRFKARHNHIRRQTHQRILPRSRRFS